MGTVNRLVLSLLRRAYQPVKPPHYLPPITCRGEIRLVILTTPPYWVEALWCAYSWLHFLCIPVGLDIFVDGKPPLCAAGQIQSIFPGGRLRTIDLPPMDGTGLSVFYRYRYGRKLFMILRESAESTIIYSDFDVLCFAPLTEVIDSVANGTPRFLREKRYNHVAPHVASKAESMGIKLPPSFNAGGLVLPKACLDTKLAAALLEDYSEKHEYLVTEQTVLAALLASQGRELPPDRYLTSFEGSVTWRRDKTDLTNVVLRHYCGMVRHRFYQQGLPRLRQLLGQYR